MLFIKEAWAQSPTPCPAGSGVCVYDIFAPARKFGSLGQLVSTLSQNFILIAGIIFFILILLIGFGMITGAGSDDAKKMEQGKNLLTYAIVGFVIIFGAFWIIQIINFVTHGSLGNIFQ